MIEILSVGKKVITCGNCGSQLVYRENETRDFRFSHMGEVDIERGFRCPVCEGFINTEGNNNFLHKNRVYKITDL